MLVNIDDIKIKKRVRKDLQDLDSLKDSLRRYGLLNPITINNRYELIAGERRLQAAKMLGWSTINAEMVEISDKISQLELELEENIQRANFSDEELLDGYNALEKLRNPSFFRRILEKISSFFTGYNEKNEEKKISKIRIASKLALLIPLGIIVIIIGAILYKTGVISTFVRSFTDILSIITIIVGGVYLARMILLKRYL